MGMTDRNGCPLSSKRSATSRYRRSGDSATNPRRDSTNRFAPGWLLVSNTDGNTPPLSRPLQ
jgi:hypothetical protein